MEFKSKLEEIMPAEELLFEPTPAFGKYKTFLEHAVTHPAKMNTNLLKFLILNFTKEGEVILDPMGGSGSTAVVAALHGRNAVCVELEKRFYEWMEKARLNVEKHPTLTPKGRIVNICGDARRLSELLSRADVAITSPPYAQTYTGGGDPEKRKKRLIKAGHNPKDFLGGKARNAVLKHYGEVDVCLTSPPYADSLTSEHDEGKETRKVLRKSGENRGKPISLGKSQVHTVYSQSKENIGNLPLGQVDSIITSPPYSNVATAKEGAISPHMQGLISKLSGIPVKDFAHNVEKLKEAVKIAQSKIPFKYGDSPNNIGNLPHGSIDLVLTSPPYEMQHQGGPDPNPVGTCIKERYPSKSNIGNLPLGNIDCCITSPPYSEALSEKAGGGSKKNVLGVGITSDGEKQAQGAPTPYSTSEDNIGNLKHGEIDVVLTSPPYDGSLEGSTRHTRGGIASRDRKIAQTGTYADIVITSPPYERQLHDSAEKRAAGAWNGSELDVEKNLPMGYSENRENIGNLKSSHEEYEALTTTPRGPLAKGLMKNGKPTYLSEMLKVYAEMFKVLKPAGLAIIIIKPFYRGLKPVDLPYHSYLLLKAVGFRLEKLYKLRLKNQSFWRVLYYKNNPNLPRLNHEYVLVMRKV